jgi:integrase
MYAPRTRQGKANLYKTDKNTYAVNIPVKIAQGVFKKNRKRISLYLSADSNETMATALQHVDKIQALINAEDWQGLINYEASLKPKVIEGNFGKQSLQELWNEYLITKQSSWEASYIENDVKQATRIFNDCPKISLDIEGANVMFNHLMSITTPKQTKRYLKQASACLTWGVRRKIIKENPYPDIIKTIATKKKNEEETDINPFSIEERNLIIDALRSGKYERYEGSHTRYADYAEFNFLTGARTSETLGLNWNHIDFEKNQIRFQEARVLATNGRAGKGVQKKGLKTQAKRDFPMNERLSSLLLKRKKEINPSDLNTNVFKNINHNSFRTGAYKTVLDKLGIEYRKPYQTRHTFITILANHSDLKLHQIAKICGTSIKVIEEHYLAKASGLETLPNL